jgi:hypothetical protein
MLTKKNLYISAALIALTTMCAAAQDDGEKRIRQALEGRQVLLKMDMPAIDSGIAMTFDDTKITYDESNHNKLCKEYGVAVKKGSKARITGVRLSSKGIEIDLDGGGSPGRDWMAGGLRLIEPAPLAKSDREVDLERQLERETNMSTLALLRNDLDFERNARIGQDERNREAFARVSRYRSDYLRDNRKNWGSKLLIVIRSRKETTSMRDLTASLAKYVEFLPRETTGN